MLTIAIPIIIYLLNCIIIKIKELTKYPIIDFTSDISSLMIFVTVLVEIGIIVYFYLTDKKDKLSKLYFVGIIISIAISLFVWLVATSASGSVQIDNGFSYEEIFEEVEFTIYISMLFSIFEINIFTLFAFKNKNNLEENIKEESKE